MRQSASRDRHLFVAITLAVTLGGCSSEALPTNKQAAMAQMTFSPEKCEEIGATMKECDGAHALPQADVSDPRNSDVRLIR